MTTQDRPQPQPDTRPLVIGVGNQDRGDDAAGPLVADMIGERHGSEIAHLIAEGDLSDLALMWEQSQTVVIVDALISGRDPGTVVEIDGLTTRLEPQPRIVSSHGFGLREALELARLLDRLPAALTIIAIEGAQFEQFAPLTPAVAEAVDRVGGRIPDLVGLISPAGTFGPSDGPRSMH